MREERKDLGKQFTGTVLGEEIGFPFHKMFLTITHLVHACYTVAKILTPVRPA